jgi:hypothetical protein
VGAVRVARLGTSGSVDHASADDLGLLLVSPTGTNSAPGRDARNREAPEKCRPRRITIRVRTAKIAAVSNRRVTNHRLKFG